MSNWEYTEENGWIHCDRPAWIEDEGAVCSRCQETNSWEETDEN